MIPISLLTVCVGLSCNITESNVRYNEIANREYATSMLGFLKGARIRLEGFNEWYKISVDQAMIELKSSLDIDLNVPLFEIQDMIKKAQQNHEIDSCYNTAVTNMRKKGLSKLPEIVPCIAKYKEEADATMREISKKLKGMADLEKYLEVIIPECEAGRDPSTCMESRTNKVVQAVNSYEQYSRNSAEHGTEKFIDNRAKVDGCKLRYVNEVRDFGEIIKRDAVTCIKNAGMKKH